MSATIPQPVATVLDEARESTRTMLLERLPTDPRRAPFYAIVADYPLRPGKALRPALCLATCRAHGGRTGDALPAAAALELLHAAFLVHDDICDGALRRRGGPSLHERHGVALSLTAGDALVSLALELMLEHAHALPGRLGLEVMRELQQMGRRTVEGQAAELLAREELPQDLDAAQYLEVVLGKTCWYSSIYPCRIGALIGSRGEADLEAMAGFAFFLGAVLQIRNDLDSLTDRTELAGQEFGADIIEGKPTLPLIHLRQAASPAERARLGRLVGPQADGTGPSSHERVEEVLGLMDAHGSIGYAAAYADGLAGAALAEFERTLGWLPPSSDLDFLRGLVLHLRAPREQP